MGEADEINVAPVIVDGQTVLRVRGVTAFPAEKRADLIASRIRAIATDRSISISMLRTEHSEDLTRILAGKQLIMVVTDADALLERLDRRNLAGAYVTRIGEVIQDYRRDRSPERLARSGLYALAATGAFMLLLWMGKRTMKRLDAVLERKVKARLTGIEAKSLRLLNAAQLWKLLRSLRVLVWVAAVLGVSLVYLDFLLHQFPWTRWFGLRLFDLLFDPLRTIGAGILAAIPDLVFLVVLVTVVRFVLKALHLLFSGIAEGAVSVTAFEREWSWPTYRLIRLLVVAFSVVVAYPYIPGSGSVAFKGVSLFLGVIFSLGSSSVISNVIAGYTMTYRRAFRIGDRVRINEHLGDVAETRLLVTHLRSPKNEEIVIPNSLILNSSVVNYSSLAREGKLILNTTVGIGYETPWRQVEAMLLQAAERTEGLLKEPGAFVLQGGALDRLLRADARIVGFAKVIQYRPLVAKLRLQLLRFGGLNLPFDGSCGEDRAGQAHSHRPRRSRPGKEVAGGCADRAEQAGERNRRIVERARRADVRIRGNEILLRLQDVRPSQ